MFSQHAHMRRAGTPRDPHFLRMHRQNPQAPTRPVPRFLAVPAGSKIRTSLLPMKTSLCLCLLLLFASAAPASAAAAADSAALVELARGHEQVFKKLASDRTAVVLQKGEKQFVIYGVTDLRSAGGILEITVKNGSKYSVNPGDVFFITNDSFGLK